MNNKANKTIGTFINMFRVYDWGIHVDFIEEGEEYFFPCQNIPEEVMDLKVDYIEKSLEEEQTFVFHVFSDENYLDFRDKFEEYIDIAVLPF